MKPLNFTFPVSLILIAVNLSLNTQAAEINFTQVPDHKWSIEWGWNNESYAKSDIHYKGVDHQFSLYGVRATDTQKTLTIQSLFNTYLNPARITIPQTNTRIAYQLDGNTAVALNLDHMKYVVSDGQTVSIEGQIKQSSYAPGTQQFLSPSFMHYEHTDGLNVVTFEYEKKFPLQTQIGNVKTRAFALVGAGIVIPKSNITMTMVGQVRNDKFHLAGTNIDVAGGIEIDYSKDYFSRLTFKVGHVNLTDVVTSARQDKASQHINYQEASLTVGVRF